MEEKVTIRIIDVSDIGKVDTHFDSYRVSYGQSSNFKSSHSFLKERLENSEVITFLAENNEGNSIGFANVYNAFSSVSIGPIWILNDLYVDPKFRRMGVASNLIKAVEEEAKRNGITRIKLETASDNLSAQSCYLECGWEKSGFIPFIRNIKG